METQNLTCIICPMGCLMEVTLDNNNIMNITGNTCQRGPEYAQKELIYPTRTVTSTIAVTGGNQPLIPVKTADEIPKNMIMQCMQIIRREKIEAPVKRGDIIIYDILGTGTNIIACADINTAENN